MPKRFDFGAAVSGTADIRIPEAICVLPTARQPEAKKQDFQQRSDPSPEEITRMTAEIRATWDAAEERRRRDWSIARPVELEEAKYGFD
jgi:hypothetical protein